MFALILAAALQTTPTIAGDFGEVVRPPEIGALIAAHPERLEAARWSDEPWPTIEYPEAAMVDAVEGDVTISCVVDVTGAARTCAALSETPAGAGFAQAVLAVSDRFRWRPAMFDGQPVQSRVQFPVPFRTRHAPTTKPDPELQQVLGSISAAGYAIGACRRFTDTATVARWDALQTAIEAHPYAGYRTYDQVFVQGYVRGRTFAAEHEARPRRAARTSGNGRTTSRPPPGRPSVNSTRGPHRKTANSFGPCRNRPGAT